ncbi:uncharacterized protein N7479_001961 [Penicillium vulpinum]|uniref:uncharacterized protein n=1 Tax=Penicillium vulpinum TaxID=29845 RepID=UPI0025492425|nr:uncharacterized protein N7479_001961 [Penicillium vulpinum]KAJ5972043.1 hypothetical protein N7479_001961 [Penicillium vulpinum]
MFSSVYDARQHVEEHFPKKSRWLSARAEGLYHLGLKCPGLERVVDGLVVGTQVCQNNTTITFDTGVFHRVRLLNHIGLKTRCAPCDARFRFNEFLRNFLLGAEDGQQICSHESCINSVWEGSKFCKEHFRNLKIDPLLFPRAEQEVLRALFKEAASVQWHPKTEAMAKILRMKSGKSTIPASQVVNIDLEFGWGSREVYQIGLADLEARKVLDCLTKYGEGVVAPSSSPLPAPPTWAQLQYEQKVKGYYTQDGTLCAKQVVEKLEKIGISDNTIFLSWAIWGFDLSYLREWLQQEGFHDVLPGNENLYLLLQEFRHNLKETIGTTCYKGKGFPLSLPVVFPLLFGYDHELAGRNHHALVDAKQLALMCLLFIDLCKPPHERVYWQGSVVNNPGIAGKRQRNIDEFFSPSQNKRARPM